MKPTIAFLYVEAGLGHIMPMTAVNKAFEAKYGDKCNIIKTSFFRDTKSENIRFVENELIREVKLHNKHKYRCALQFLPLRIVGSKYSMKFLMEVKYKKGLKESLDYVKKINADLYFNTHFATMYYTCKLKAEGQINADIVTYCPDPKIGLQWDRRVDNIALSSEWGKKVALKTGFKEEQVTVVPFLIREEIASYNKGKEFYREQLNIPKDNFTILCADGAYGAGRLKATVEELLKFNKKITVIAVTGKNEELYQYFLTLKPNENITFLPFGFTDKMLLLSATCDLFIGKAGASNLAEPCYFGAPQIINFLASPVERWIANHYLHYVKSAIRTKTVEQTIEKVKMFLDNKSLLEPYQKACESQHRIDGPEILADMLYQRLIKKYEEKNNEV